MDHNTECLQRTADPAAWEPDDIERSQRWRHDFTESELAELSELARHGDQAAPGRACEQPLLASSMAATARELKSGLGFRILRGFPLEDLDLRRAARGFSALSRRLGVTVEQPEGVMLAHVRAESENHERLGFRTAGELPFHADPEDVIGFLCIRPALTGGVRRLASAASVYNILAAEHPGELRVLTSPFHVALQHPHPDHGHPWTRLPFLSIREGVFGACAFPVHIRRAQKLAGVPELTDAQNRALEVFNTVAERVAVSLELQAGDIEYFNNHVVLHTRTRFTDDGAGRHLLRVWLSVAGFRPLHPDHPVRLRGRMKGSDAA